MEAGEYHEDRDVIDCFDKIQIGAFVNRYCKKWGTKVKNHVLSNDGGNIPFNNFIFTANNCYLYNTIVGDIYPIKFWNIELNRDEIKSYTKAIQKLLSQRDAKDIDKVIESFFGSAGNDATYTPSYREEQGSNNRNDVLLEG